MWPIRISLSDAPGSYFFCARAAGDARTAASSAATGTSLDFMRVSSFGGTSAILPLSPQPRHGHAHRAGNPGGHQVNEADQEQAEDRPGGGLGDLVGDVRHELDEQGAVDGPRNRRQPPDDDA